MDMDMNWSLETYRLDEIERKFGLPCVIHLNEGYYSPTDAEVFSQGDVMSIDSKLTLHKVAANFVRDLDRAFGSNLNHDYVELATAKEILLPLNYKGRLKVIQKPTTFDSVKQLADVFPRYAKLRQNLAVITEDNKTITLHAGTIIELDRIIPGETYKSAASPDRLIIQFDHLNKRAVIALPLDLMGKFKTENDPNEYTMKEAIDRYSLPQYVRFVDDEIKRVYTKDLVEGLGNMKLLTDTYRLNRLVTQEVLVGHLKYVDDPSAPDDNSSAFKQRTLILLPTENPEIKDIEVNVSLDRPENSYEDLFMVRNVSRSDDHLMDGALYIDFADCSGIRRLSTWEKMAGANPSFPPPLPPKPVNATPEYAAGNGKGSSSSPYAYMSPSRPNPRTKPGNCGKGSSSSPHAYMSSGLPNNGATPGIGKVSSSSPYACMSPSIPRNNAKPGNRKGNSSSPFAYMSSSLPNNCAKPAVNLATLPTRKPRSGSDCRNNSRTLNTRSRSSSLVEDQYVSMGQPRTPIKTGTTAGVSIQDKLNNVLTKQVHHTDLSSTNESLYQEIDQIKPPRLSTFQSPRPRESNCKATPWKSPRPTAMVSPTNSTFNNPLNGTGVKLFQDLSTSELVERLRKGGLNELSEICERERLNGAFFLHFSKETLETTLGLKDLQLAKFMQMRDKNWVPT